MMDKVTDPQRAHVFVDCDDSNVWCLWSDSTAWHWTNMDKPSGVNVKAFMGAVTVMDTPDSPQRAHVFIQGDDLNLWCRWTDGTAWHWTNLGKPPGANLRTMGAITVMDTPTSPQRAHVFVLSDDPNLWCLWSDGTAWNWDSLGKPTDANTRAFMGAVTMMDTPASPQRGHVFVQADDLDIWCLWSSGS
jgi:hypothetical protein